MANQKNDVTIVAWPKDTSKLEHQFKKGSPCELLVSFQKDPANVVIHTTPETPFNVDMDMKLSVKDTVPVCVRLCEPVCAKSDYTISVNIFDRPVGSISIKGLTKLFNCLESTKPERTCVDFREQKDGTVIRNELTHYGLKFVPLANELRVYSSGEPAGMNKLRFPDEGVKITFPFPVDSAGFTIINHAGPVLKFEIYDNEGLVRIVEDEVYDEPKVITVEEKDFTTVIIKGGSNEAALLEVCYVAF
jgi:hypothetical protein